MKKRITKFQLLIINWCIGSYWDFRDFWERKDHEEYVSMVKLKRKLEEECLKD